MLVLFVFFHRKHIFEGHIESLGDLDHLGETRVDLPPEDPGEPTLVKIVLMRENLHGTVPGNDEAFEPLASLFWDVFGQPFDFPTGRLQKLQFQGNSALHICKFAGCISATLVVIMAVLAGGF